MTNFNVGDKVVLNGTSSPIMTIQGHPTHFSSSDNSDKTLYVCFWEDSNGPHRENYSPSRLVLFPNS
jgi:uncharacterized protein YodC (DUF2158 family)